MEFKKEDILELIDKFENSSVTEMSFTHENTSLQLKKQTTGKIQTTKQEPEPVDEKKEAKEEAEANAATPVKAPLAGIFYRAPKPDAEVFVKTGQSVKKGDVVGIIEAMKMMNEISAPVSGRVIKINTENGEFAQYGDALMLIEEE